MPYEFEMFDEDALFRAAEQAVSEWAKSDPHTMGRALIEAKLWSALTEEEFQSLTISFDDSTDPPRFRLEGPPGVVAKANEATKNLNDGEK